MAWDKNQTYLQGSVSPGLDAPWVAGSFPNSTRFKYVRYNIYFESVGFGYNEENKVCRKLSQRFDHRQKTLDSSGESTYSRCRGVAYMYIFVI